MNHRSPRASIAFYLYCARRVGAADEIVEHNVAAESRRGAKNGRGTHRDYAVLIIVEFLEPDLRFPFCACVGGYCVFRATGRLLDFRIRIGDAIHAVRGSIDESLRACLVRGCAQTDACVAVDLFGQSGSKLAEGVVRECGEMYDGVDADKILSHNVPYIFSYLAIRLGGRREPRIVIVAGIESNDLVAACAKHRHEDASDVTAIPSDEYIHRIFPVLTMWSNAFLKYFTIMWRSTACTLSTISYSPFFVATSIFASASLLSLPPSKPENPMTGT